MAKKDEPKYKVEEVPTETGRVIVNEEEEHLDSLDLLVMIANKVEEIHETLVK